MTSPFLTSLPVICAVKQVEGEVKHEAIPEEDSMPDDQVNPYSCVAAQLIIAL
jgi:hypothetical protein